jgi:hypothetical protein
MRKQVEKIGIHNEYSTGNILTTKIRPSIFSELKVKT